MASAASAATLALISGASQPNLVNYNPIGMGTANGSINLNGQTINYIDGATKTAMNGLQVTGPSTITFTYRGFEAGNQNDSYGVGIGGGFSFVNGSTALGATSSYNVSSAQLVNFEFRTTAPASAQGVIANQGAAVPASPNYSIGYYKVSDTRWYALFDDIAAGDRDFDDLVLQIDVAPVPLPAAGFLLLGGLGAMGAVARRRKA